MSMQSTSLLPRLRELPSDGPERRQTYREQIEALLKTDPAMMAAEVTSATSLGIWGIFDQINADDTLAKAHSAFAANYDGSLHEHWQDVFARGPDSAQGFISALKGKVAEFNTVERLEDQGLTNVSIAENPNQTVWDIRATAPDGSDVLIQVKTGAAEYAGEVQNAMLENPDVDYYVSSELFDKIAQRSPELVDQMTDIGSTIELEGSVNEGLNLLSGNMGIDIPDGIGEILPYAGVIIAGARLVHSVIKTEKTFEAVDRTTKNKIQVVQTLTLMSRMGITTVLSAVGSMGGVGVGSLAPGIGNLVGGIVGTLAGAGMGMYLNRHLQPHMLDLALDITGLTNDDLFYFKNKPYIDQAALTFQRNANALAVQLA